MSDRRFGAARVSYRRPLGSSVSCVVSEGGRFVGRVCCAGGFSVASYGFLSVLSASEVVGSFAGG